jgi:SAM-dependent methyltransferase
LQVFAAPQINWCSAFDYVLALEVLEHIRDDAAALQQWHSWLKPGGHLLLSVPAHRSHWSATDDWAGHFRRYERNEILTLLRDEGFAAVAAECYGFPLANMLGPLRARYHARQLSRRSGQSRADCTRSSGIERGLEARLYPLQASRAGTLFMKLFFAVQALFLKTDLGNGLLILCRRK